MGIREKVAFVLHFSRSDPMNTLYYGDNLNILRRYIKDDSDLRKGFRILCSAASKPIVASSLDLPISNFLEAPYVK